MENKIFILALTLLLSARFSLNAQVGINTENSNPDASAMLDVSSTDKGLLIPRMNSINREAIVNPADGLMVYDSTTTTFWYYDEEQWNEIRNGSSTIKAADLFDPLPDPDFSCLELKGSIQPGGFIRDIAMFGSYAYVTTKPPFAPGHLRIIDLSDPTNPTQVGSTQIGTELEDVATSGQYFCGIESIGSGDLRIIDVSDPANPVSKAVFNIDVNMEEIFMSNNLVYAVGQEVRPATDDMIIIDISDPNNPSNIAGLEFEGVIRAITISGNYAYLIGSIFATGDAEMKIVDISDPSNPSNVGSIVIGDINSFPSDIVVSGSLVFISDAVEDKLVIIDVGNPANPALVNSVDIDQILKVVATVGNHVLYTTRDNDELVILDVSDPNNPVVVNSVSSSGSLSAPAAYLGNLVCLETSVGNNSLLEVATLTCPGLVNMNPLSGEFTMLEGASQTGHVLTADGSGSAHWVAPEAVDNMGNHTASQNIQLDEFWLSGDGDDEGVRVDASGKVGMGTDSPNHQLEVQGGSIALNQNHNFRFLRNDGSDAANVAAEFEGLKLFENRGGTTTQLKVGTFGDVFEFQHITGGITSNRLRINSDGKVGVGRTATTNLLEVEGNASKSSAGDWLANSDARLKTNIQQLNAELTLQKLLSLRGVTYKWSDDKTGTIRPEGVQYGFTAQNIQAVFPELVEEDAQGYLQTAYGTYDAMYVEAIRALNAKIEILEINNKSLTKSNKLLKEDNEKLKADNAQIDQLAQDVALLKAILQLTANNDQ